MSKTINNIMWLFVVSVFFIVFIKESKLTNNFIAKEFWKENGWYYVLLEDDEQFLKAKELLQINNIAELQKIN